ncbi:Snf7-domain-containing protein, partial [Blyttiomyces helicus]
GNTAQAKTLAKQLIRLRKQTEKNTSVQSQIQSVGHRTLAMQSTLTMTKGMTGATQAMKTANKQMDLAKMQKTMAEYATQNEMMDMKEEMSMFSVVGCKPDSLRADDEEEGEEIMNQVLDEIGISVSQQVYPPSPPPAFIFRAPFIDLTLPTFPRSQLPSAGRAALPAGKEKESRAEEDALQARLDELMRGG